MNTAKLLYDAFLLLSSIRSTNKWCYCNKIDRYQRYRLGQAIERPISSGICQKQGKNHRYHFVVLLFTIKKCRYNLYRAFQRVNRPISNDIGKKIKKCRYQWY